MESDAAHPDLWAKVAKLNRWCTVEFHRVGEPRLWQVVLTKGQESITQRDVSLARVLAAALRAAEERGWAPEPI
jgi:hypothetical protein